jgi:hypothetical protein
MRYFRLMLLAGAMLMPAAANAATIRGAGAGSCGMWLKSRAEYRPDHVMLHWVLGYLSGAVVHGDNGDPLRDKDADGIFYWVDNYCRTNPLNSLAEALDTLVRPF